MVAFERAGQFVAPMRPFKTAEAKEPSVKDAIFSMLLLH